jgi:hypothetical protein
MNVTKMCRKHLNICAVFFSAGSGLVGYLVIKLILICAGLSFIPSPLGLYSFNYQTGIDIAIVVSTPAFAWILKQKNRSLWYICFFLPPLIPLPLVWLNFVFLLPFWIAGLVILVLLKTK